MKFVLVVVTALLGAVAGRPEGESQIAQPNQLQRSFDDQFATNQGLVGSFQDVAGRFPAAGEAADKALAPSAAVPGRFSYYVNSVHPAQNPQAAAPVEGLDATTEDLANPEIIAARNQIDSQAPASALPLPNPYFGQYGRFGGYMNPYFSPYSAPYGTPYSGYNTPYSGYNTAYSGYNAYPGYAPWSMNPYSAYMSGASYLNRFVPRYPGNFFNTVDSNTPVAASSLTQEEGA